MKLSFRGKLIISCEIVTLLALGVIGGLALYFSSGSIERLAKENLLGITDAMYQSIKNQHHLSTSLNASLQKSNLDVAYNMVAGKIEADPKRKIALSVENQDNHTIEKVQIPELLYNNRPVYKNNSIVDNIAEYTGSE
ncbi:MAG TPA: Cache 3/Cache 2 fusion domain-containing protein, partial [Spirochaetota bacterium]|nr:Cache 3/Cache 2 fusion domain-containing protein [Spirochaetota bacterium]